MLQNNKSISNNKNSKFTFKTQSSPKKLKTIKQICENYKKDIIGNTNTTLYNSCKINQYCRKYKCKNIDKIFTNALTKKLGNNYNTLLMSSLYSKCPHTMQNKTRKRCISSAMKTFYKNNDLDNIYSKVLECDNKLCSKERKIFNTNLFRIRNKKNKFIHKPKSINIEELPDKEMIQIN